MLNFNIYFIFVLISKNSLLYSNTESLFTFFFTLYWFHFHECSIFSYLSWDSKHSFFEILLAPCMVSLSPASCFLFVSVAVFTLECYLKTQVIFWVHFNFSKVVQCWLDCICVRAWDLSNSGASVKGVGWKAFTRLPVFQGNLKCPFL